MSPARPLVIRLALRSYPSWWRDRYGNDAASTSDDLLAEGRSALGLARSCLVGALREWWRGPGGSSSPIAARQRLTLSVIGSHGSWMLALPIALLLEVMVVEQGAVGPFGPGGGPSPVLAFEVLSLISSAVAVVLFGTSVFLTWRQAKMTDHAAARQAAAPFKAALFSTLALAVLVAVPLTLDHWEFFAVPNWHPRFLFGWRPVVPAGFAVPGGTFTAVILLVATWMVIVVGPVVAIRGFTAASRRLESTASASGQALLGSLATVALTVNWVILLLWAVASAPGESGSVFLGYARFSAPPSHEPDVVFVLLAVMVVPLVVGLRSSARSLRTRLELRRS